MKHICPLIILAAGLAGCASERLDPSPLEVPAGPIIFQVSASARGASIVQDKRISDDVRTKRIPEFKSTTVLIGDDLLEPNPPTLLADKLLQCKPGLNKGNSVVLKLFLISISGRSPEEKSYQNMFVPIYGPKAVVLLGIRVAGPTLTDDSKLVPPPPGGYSADLLRVAVEGEVNGVEFSAKDSKRLSGVVSDAEIKDLVNTVLEEAAATIAPHLVDNEGGSPKA